MIELTKEQQVEEDARLAKEVLDNPIFQRVFEEFEKTFTDQLMNLEPEDKEAFPIVQAPRKYLKLIKNQIQNYANATYKKDEPSRIVA